MAFAVEVLGPRADGPGQRPSRRRPGHARPPPPSSSRCGAASSTPSRRPPATSRACWSRRSGSAYREWKSERIERIAGDVLAAAFSRGTWHEVPDGTPLRWIVEDTDGPCPDCDDDALAGSLPKGEAFPTGQPLPARPHRLPLPPGAGHGVSGTGSGDIFSVPAIRSLIHPH